MTSKHDGPDGPKMTRRRKKHLCVEEVCDKASHRTFREHQHLPFPIVADTTGATQRAYGVGAAMPGLSMTAGDLPGGTGRQDRAGLAQGRPAGQRQRGARGHEDRVPAAPHLNDHARVRARPRRRSRRCVRRLSIFRLSPTPAFTTPLETLKVPVNKQMAHAQMTPEKGTVYLLQAAGSGKPGSANLGLQ